MTQRRSRASKVAYLPNFEGVADARYNIELVLDAAEACLTRDTDASMSDIAAEAGLGRVTIYGHFASRQVCDRGVGPPRLGH